jgi:CelD/BcsL family acetyltransferase involved in cellulose biosynthesis
MKLYHIRTIEEFKKYKENWDQILEINQNTNPFIEFEWILNWWIYIGKEKIIEIIAVEKNDEYIAFFPFQFTYKWKSTVLEFMGRDEANYMDVIVCDKDRKTTIAYVLDELIATNPNLIFNLQGLLSSSKTTNILFAYLRNRKYPTTVFSSISPYINVESIDLNAYLKPREKLHGLDRRERRLRLLGEVELVTNDPIEMDTVFALHDKHWKKKLDTSKFTNQEHKNFYQSLLLVKGRTLEVKVDALLLNNQMIAFSYGFLCRGRYISFSLGHDDDYNMYSPGRILLKELIAESRNREIKIFDMSDGYEPYKLDWNTGLDTTNRVIFSSKEWSTKIIVQLMKGKGYLKATLNKNHKVVLFRRQVLGRISHVIRNIKEIKWLKGLINFRSSLFSRKSIDLYQQPVGNSAVVDFQLMSHEEVIKEEIEHTHVNKKFYNGFLPYRGTDTSMFWVHPKVIRMDEFNYLQNLPKQSFFVDEWQVHQLPDICSFLRHEQQVKDIFISTSKRDESLTKHLKHLGFSRVNHISKVCLFNISKTRVTSEIE